MEDDNLVSMHLVMLTSTYRQLLKNGTFVCSHLRFAVCPSSMFTVQMALA
jgi:hypothetical protein